MIKRKIAMLTAVVMLLFFTWTPGVTNANVSSKVIVVDNNIIFDSLISGNHNGVLMIPARELAKSIGGSFNYDTSTMTGTLAYRENELVFSLDSSVARHNGKLINLLAPMKIVNFRYMVPAQFSFEMLGNKVYENSSRNMLMVYRPIHNKLIYNVLPGDSLWIISRLFDTTISSIKHLNGLSGDVIFSGQKLVIGDFHKRSISYEAYTSNSATLSSGTSLSVKAVGYLRPWTRVNITGKNGSWYKVTTPIGEGYIHQSVMWIKQDISQGNSTSQYFNKVIPVDTSKNYVTYTNYTVKQGDNLWSISESMGIPNTELEKANNLSSNSTIYVGQVLKIPVHHIPKKDTISSDYGEVLDWFSEGRYVFPIGATGRLIDVQTGRSFMIKRTMGATHADCETLTKQDTQIMREIFGGNWTWNRRSFILETNGRRFAVSVMGMPHAGVDGVPYLRNVANRSGGYGHGPNYDRIPGNGMDGHFCVYFLNSLRHNDSRVDAQHQQNVMSAAGLR
ncbi:UNVERIFIED_CONTAM: LysM repeat protein [Acetivibrio alkalicellulosi]